MSCDEFLKGDTLGSYHETEIIQYKNLIEKVGADDSLQVGGISAGAVLFLKTGKCAVVNAWVDPNKYALGTKAQTMYK